MKARVLCDFCGIWQETELVYESFPLGFDRSDVRFMKCQFCVSAAFDKDLAERGEDKEEYFAALRCDTARKAWLRPGDVRASGLVHAHIEAPKEST